MLAALRNLEHGSRTMRTERKEVKNSFTIKSNTPSISGINQPVTPKTQPRFLILALLKPFLTVIILHWKSSQRVTAKRNSKT